MLQEFAGVLPLPAPPWGFLSPPRSRRALPPAPASPGGRGGSAPRVCRLSPTRYKGRSERLGCAAGARRRKGARQAGRPQLLPAPDSCGHGTAGAAAPPLPGPPGTAQPSPRPAAHGSGALGCAAGSLGPGSGQRIRLSRSAELLQGLKCSWPPASFWAAAYY